MWRLPREGDLTTVVIRGNGAFDPSSIRSLRLEDPLRIWMSVSHIETFFKPNEIGVGSREIERIRIGYHPEDSPPALYIVLDLAGDDVFLLDTSVQGDVDPSDRRAKVTPARPSDQPEPELTGTPCVFVSDLHGSAERYRKLYTVIETERPAAVFLGGDLLPNHWAAALGGGDFIGSDLGPGISQSQVEDGIGLSAGLPDPGQRRRALQRTGVHRRRW